MDRKKLEHFGLLRIDNRVSSVEASLALLFIVFCTFPRGKNHLSLKESEELGKQLGTLMLNRGKTELMVMAEGPMHVKDATENFQKYSGDFEKQADVFTLILQSISQQKWYNKGYRDLIVDSLKEMMNSGGGENQNQLGIISLVEKG